MLVLRSSRPAGVKPLMQGNIFLATTDHFLEGSNIILMLSWNFPPPTFCLGGGGGTWIFNEINYIIKFNLKETVSVILSNLNAKVKTCDLQRYLLNLKLIENAEDNVEQ